MANFKVFTNASIPFEGKKIAIDVDHVKAIFENVLEDGSKVTLWSKDNNWTVQEDFDTVLKTIKE